MKNIKNLSFKAQNFPPDIGLLHYCGLKIISQDHSSVVVS